MDANALDWKNSFVRGVNLLDIFQANFFRLFIVLTLQAPFCRVHPLFIYELLGSLVYRMAVEIWQDLSGISQIFAHRCSSFVFIPAE